MSIWLWLTAGASGGIFSLARFLVDGAISTRLDPGFPWGTFVVNVSGSFVLGVLVGTGASDRTYLIAGTACLGSYTTFSTWMLEAHRLGEDDDRRPLVAYIVASLAVGLLAAATGRQLGRML
jgi:CrcB protein